MVERRRTSRSMMVRRVEASASAAPASLSAPHTPTGGHGPHAPHSPHSPYPHQQQLPPKDKHKSLGDSLITFCIHDIQVTIVDKYDSRLSNVFITINFIDKITNTTASLSKKSFFHIILYS